MKTILILLLITTLNAKKLEKDYQEEHCKHKIEYRLPDKTRIDCLEPLYATEYDFANKWAESIGQSLFYALMTNKKPKVVIIKRYKKDDKYIKRLKLVTDRYNIKVEIIDVSLKIDKKDKFKYNLEKGKK